MFLPSFGKADSDVLTILMFYSVSQCWTGQGCLLRVKFIFFDGVFFSLLSQIHAHLKYAKLIPLKIRTRKILVGVQQAGTRTLF